MYWGYILYLILLAIAAALNLVLAAYAWRKPRSAAATTFAIMMLLASWLPLTTGLSMVSPNAQRALFWFKLAILSLSGLPVCWLVFALQYTGRQRLIVWERALLLSLIPLTTQAMLWLMPEQNLFVTDWGIIRQGGAFFASRRLAVVGPWFWVHSMYSYLLTLLATSIIVRTALQAFPFYRKQALALLAGTLSMLIVSILDTGGIIDTPLVMAPIGFTLGGIAFAWGLRHYQLFNIAPVARDRLLEGMNDGMLVLDAQHRVVDVNTAMLELLNIEARGVIGQPLSTALRHHRAWTAHFQTSPEAELATEAEDEQQRAAECGTQRFYDMRASELHDRRSNIIGRVILLRDITERKRAEAELRRYAANLEASNDELDTFAHTVAHGIKDPLMLIVGYSDILTMNLERLTPEAIRNRLHAIAHTGMKIADIVDALLVLAGVRRVEEVHWSPLNMHQIIRNASDRLASNSGESRSAIHFPEKWPIAWGYEPWVEEVWVNYLSNAIRCGSRATNSLRIKVGWHTTCQEEITTPFSLPREVPVSGSPAGEGSESEGPANSNICLCFWVHNNGPGLTELEQKQVYHPFTRLHQEQTEGHGLGLTIARRIITRLGGTVGVESAPGPGEGATFWFTLPAAALPETEGTQQFLV